MKKKLKLKKIKFIPVNTPVIFKEDKKNVNICLKTNWLSSEGNFVKDFEKKFSKYNNRKYGIAVSSGTAALEISLKSLNIKNIVNFGNFYLIDLLLINYQMKI